MMLFIEALVELIEKMLYPNPSPKGREDKRRTAFKPRRF